MTEIADQPQFVLGCLALTLVGAVAILVFWRQAERFLVAAGAAVSFVVVVGLALGLAGHLQSVQPTQQWERGWLLPFADSQSLRVGILADGWALTAAILSTLLAAFPLIFAIGQKNRTARACAALMFSGFSASLAWISISPLLSQGAILFSTLAAVVWMGGTSTTADARIQSQFGWMRMASMLLGLWGVIALDSSQSSAQLLGGWLLVFAATLGLFVFPATTWLLAREKSIDASTQRLDWMIFQVLPALTWCAVFFRSAPKLLALGIFPSAVIFWSIASVAGAMVSIFQRNSRVGLSVWLSAYAAVQLCVLVLSDVGGGMMIALGGALASSGLVLVRQGTMGVRVRTVVLGVCSMGLVGTIGGSAWMGALTHADSRPVVVGSVIFAAVFSGISFWRWIIHGWSEALESSVHEPPGAESSAQQATQITASAICALSGLALIWTGFPLGRSTSSGDSALFGSLLAALTKIDDFTVGEILPWLTILGGAQAVSILIGVWLGVRQGAWTERLRAKAPRMAAFFESGWRVSESVQKMGVVNEKIGRLLVAQIDERFWMTHFPAMGNALLRRVGNLWSRVDEASTRHGHRIVAETCDAPARFFQFLQSGDIQWYLLFGLGTGIALLVHFWIVRG